MARRKDSNQALHEIILEFHKRAFGKEMARVNFLPVAERRKYLARLRARAAKIIRPQDEGGFLAG